MQLTDADAIEAISEEVNASTLEETVAGTPIYIYTYAYIYIYIYILNDEIISTLERKFETFSESIESRLLNIEEQIVGQGITILSK